MDKVVSKSTAMGYLVAAAASTALVCVGIFFLVGEARKKREDRMKIWIILGIVMSVLGSVLLLGITILFLMSGLSHKMNLEVAGSTKGKAVGSSTTQSGGGALRGRR